MSDEHQPELRPLRDLLGALEYGHTTMQSGGNDVTKRGVDLLKREIVNLDKIIADLRLKTGSKD